MNYIELINGFWQLNKEHSFTGNETQLYFKLLDTCNSLGWKNPFNQSNGYICGELGMTEKTLIKCRNKLQQVNLIKFVSGKVKREKTIYTLLGCSLGCNNYNLSSSLSDSLMVELTPDNIKHKLNKTKQKEDIVVRKLKFSSTLKPFLEIYGKDFLSDFYHYWTEPNKSNTKFRQELEKTWDLKRRLETWAKNDKNFKKIENEKSTGGFTKNR